MRIRKILSITACLLGLGLLGLLLLLRQAGIPLAGITEAPAVGAGLVAKLACSARYVSGFDRARIESDLALQSPAVRFVALDFDRHFEVSARLLGVEALARYYPGLGCTLQRDDMFPLERLSVPAPGAGQRSPAWPQEALDAELQGRVEAMLARDAAEGLDTRALLVVEAGRVVAEAYAPGVSAQTPLLGWSMGKSLTGMIVGRMAALGMLAVDARGLFPEWADDSRAEISLQNLLQMSTGLSFSETYLPGNDSTRMLFTATDASGVALEQPLQYAPGSHFSYSSGTTNLLCRVIGERLQTPQRFVDFFAAEVAAPLGLQHTVVELDPSGNCVGSSFVYASARDWARMASPLLNDGWVGERQWLSPRWVELATSVNASSNQPHYGYQLWLNSSGTDARWPQLPADTFAMLGHNGQSVVIVPSRDTVIVRLGWNTGDYPVDARMAELLSAP